MIGHTYYHLWKGSALTSTSMIGHTYYHLWKGSALTYIQAGTHPTTMMEMLALTSDLVGTNPTVKSELPPVLLD